jgi:hypothetical protein
MPCAPLSKRPASSLSTAISSACGCESRAKGDKYATLGTIFFRGSIAGQIKSVFKTRETNPAKVVEYRQALANEDCTLGTEPLPQSLVAKLKVLGIEV